MMKVDLGRLAREGSLVVEGRIPPDDALWEDSGIPWSEPVDIRLRISEAGSGEVVGRGRVKGTLKQECRRCLEPVSTGFDADLTIVFAGGESEVNVEESGTFPYNPGARELDLSAAVREEVLLAMNPYVVCAPGCPGLCPKCGANLKEGACGCAEGEQDHRWAALRELKKR
jgi:uncharacterized protein